VAVKGICLLADYTYGLVMVSPPVRTCSAERDYIAYVMNIVE